MPEVTPSPADVEAAEKCWAECAMSQTLLLGAYAGLNAPPPESSQAIIARHIARARAEERGGCAKITDDWEPSAGDRQAMRYDPADAWVGIDMAREGISKAIRARNDA